MNTTMLKCCLTYKIFLEEIMISFGRTAMVYYERTITIPLDPCMGRKFQCTRSSYKHIVLVSCLPNKNYFC